MLEDVGLDALHELDVVVGKLEGGTLEIHVSWGAREHEAEIDVDDVTVDVDQDVVVVPVFDVEVVLDEGIACETLDEIGQASLPIHSKDLPVDILQAPLMRYLFQIADRPRIIDKLDES